MFKFILKQYLRNISNRKLFWFINITGLAFAIAFVALIGRYLLFEHNYNHDIKNVDNIYS